MYIYIYVCVCVCMCVCVCVCVSVFINFFLLLMLFVYLFLSFFTEILDLICSCVTIYYGKIFLFIFSKAICIFRFNIMKKKKITKEKK